MNGEANPQTPLTLYFNACLLPTLKKKQTIESYRTAMASLQGFAGHVVKLGEVNAKLLGDWKRRLYGKREISPKTIRKWQEMIAGMVATALPVKETDLLDDAEPLPPGSLADLFEQRYRPERMFACKLNSIEQIQITLHIFDRYLGRPATLADLNSETVSSFLAWYLKEGVSVRTVNGKRSHLNSLWRFARRKQLVLHGPDVDALPEYRRLPQAWSIEQMSAIIATAAKLKGKLVQRPHWLADESPSKADFWPAFLLFIYDTGLRLGAAMSAEYDNLDWDTGWIKIEAEQQKQRVEQQFRLSEQTMGFLRRLKRPERKLLFDWPLRKREIQLQYKEILRRAEVPDDSKHMFHCIRRTTATHICKAVGIEKAAQHLGHSTSDVTKRYIDPSLISERDATEYLPRLSLNGKGK